MTTEQLLTKIREFATNNYCSCEGRIHDPENLMERLLKECEKWEEEINEKDCKHDWAYDVPDLPRLRVCQLCSRRERREIIGISYSGLPDFNQQSIVSGVERKSILIRRAAILFSEWTPIIGDMDLDKTKKEAKKR